jgi:hypothetical protein
VLESIPGVEAEAFLFRGTIAGWPGRYGVSPTSESPLVATHFAVAAGNAGRAEGVVYVIPRAAVADKILPPQYNALPYELEVPLDILPANIPRVSVRVVPASEARSILRELGCEVPSDIVDAERLTTALKIAPPMTSDQIAAFLKAIGL